MSCARCQQMISSSPTWAGAVRLEPMSGTPGASGGHNRKPTNLKILQGTYRKDRDSGREPQPPVGIPPKPKWMTKAARKYWRPLMCSIPPGVMTHADDLAAALLCEALAEYVAATDWRQRSAWAKLTLSLLREFGMTPASRGRVHVAPPEALDEFDALFR
jgi:phage terminase small subunit